jgi:hypothetical protein
VAEHDTLRRAHRTAVAGLGQDVGLEIGVLAGVQV